MNEYVQYLKNIADVAIRCETSAEAAMLAEYVRNTIPDATGTEYEQAYCALSLACERYKDAPYEACLEPAIAILCAINIFNPWIYYAQQIHRLADDSFSIFERMSLDGDYDVGITYEDFCDEHSDLLNR